jgi:hypothetical protein
MKEIVTLKTGNGSRVRIVLDHRDSGLDEVLRRWTFENPYWRCKETGELGEQSGPVAQLL